MKSESEKDLITGISTTIDNNTVNRYSFIGNFNDDTNKVSQQPLEVPIIAYLDFDGTLTSLPGSSLVFSDFYKALQENPNQDYNLAKFKPNLVGLLKNAAMDKSMPKEAGLAPGVLEFIESTLSQSGDINIISRNRKEYIQAVLELAGLSQEKLAKLTIKGVKELTNDKGTTVTLLKGEKPKAIKTIICDDDANDYKLMVNAVKDASGRTQIIGYNEKPGLFNWAEVTNAAISENVKLSK